MRLLMQPLGRMICLQRQRGFHFILSDVSPNARAARLKGTASVSWSTLCEGQKKILSEVQFEVPPCRYLWGRGCSQCNLDCSRCWTSRCFLLSQAQPTANGEAAMQTRRHYSVGKALRHFFGQRSHYSTFSSLACAYIPLKRCVCLHLYSVVFVPGSYASTVLWEAWRGWDGYDYAHVPSYDDWRKRNNIVFLHFCQVRAGNSPNDYYNKLSDSRLSLEVNFYLLTHIYM